MSTPGTEAGDAGFIEDAAKFATGGMLLDQLAARHGLTPDQALDRMEDPAITAAVDRAIATREAGDDAIKDRARQAIASGVRQLAERIESGECAPAHLLRMVEVLGKLSIPASASTRVVVASLMSPIKVVSGTPLEVARAALEHRKRYPSACAWGLPDEVTAAAEASGLDLSPYTGARRHVG